MSAVKCLMCGANDERVLFLEHAKGECPFWRAWDALDDIAKSESTDPSLAKLARHLADALESFAVVEVPS